MGYEIERKWLPKREDAEKMMIGASHVYIEQGYICTDPVIRIRKEDDHCYLTCKGKGFLKREEINLPLSNETYESLLPKCDNILIKKKRYKIPYGETGLLIELDIFEGEHAGLIILEIEFKDEESASAFNAPSYFGPEVTGNPDYTNARLSLQNPKVCDRIHD